MDPYMVTPQPSNQQNQALHGPVAILWDIENCCVPSNVRPEDVAGNIRMALRVHPVVQGVVTLFSAYGDFNSFSIKLREGCQRTGVKLTDVPNGRKDAADKAILVDMFLFALDNRPPSSIVLISGDVDFAPALHILGQRGYEIIIVVPSGICVSPALSNAGRYVWDWPSVARGEGSMPAKAFIYRGPDIATNLSGCHISDSRDEKSVVYRGMPQGDYIAQANINQMYRSQPSSHAYGDPTRASHSFSDNSSHINLISMPSFPNTNPHSYPSNVFSGRDWPSVWDWPSVARGEGSMPAKAFIYRGPDIATNLSGCHISDNRDEKSVVYRGMPQGDYIAQANINQMSRSQSSSHAYGDPTRAQVGLAFGRV